MRKVKAKKVGEGDEGDGAHGICPCESVRRRDSVSAYSGHFIPCAARWYKAARALAAEGDAAVVDVLRISAAVPLQLYCRLYRTILQGARSRSGVKDGGGDAPQVGTRGEAAWDRLVPGGRAHPFPPDLPPVPLPILGGVGMGRERFFPGGVGTIGRSGAAGPLGWRASSRRPGATDP